MGERIVVSGGEALRELCLPQAQAGRQIALEGAGALCAAGNALYVASRWGDTIWRFDAKKLIPTGLFAGGPGVCRMLTSPSGNRLYALCAEADSVLMLDAQSGAPLMVNRVGVGPCAMAMDESGQMIAVAGGGDGEIALIETDTLRVVRRLQTEGMTLSTALLHGGIYALSLNEAMNTTLTAVLPSGARRTLRLQGMPGALEAIDGQLVAATHEQLSVIDSDGSRVLASCDVSGRAGKIWHSGMGWMILDTWSESLYLRGRGTGCWRLLTEQVSDAVRMP